MGVSMVSDFGVFGEDCEAMVVISEKGTKLRMRSGGRLWNEKKREPFGLNQLIALRTPRNELFALRRTLHERMRPIGLEARPAGLG